MFLGNSDQDTIRTIRLDPHCPCKIFIKFHQKLIIFSISNAFKKMNWRQHSLTHIVLNIMIFFDLSSIFRSFQQIVIKGQYSLTHVILVLRILPKKVFFQMFIKQESRTEWFVPHCPFHNLIKFLKSPPIFFLFQIFSRYLSQGQCGLTRIVLSIKF